VKEKKTIAVIDIGTNSFHLLIVRIDEEGAYHLLRRERKFVKLALDGIHKISKKQFDKGVATLTSFRTIVEQYEPDDVLAFGTAAIREAENGREFIDKVKQELNLSIYCIDGDTEATMIYYGVRNAVNLTHKPVLIVDIGGGSVEFVIGDEEQIYWQTSLPIGASLLKDRYHHHDPMPKREIDQLRNDLRRELATVKKQVDLYEPDQLIGVAGSFETVADIISANNADFHYSHDQIAHHLPVDKFLDLHKRLTASTLDERLAIKGMHPERADMIVVASTLTHLIIEDYGIREMSLSRYGLKEGILYSVVNQIPIAAAEL